MSVVGCERIANGAAVTLPRVRPATKSDRIRLPIRPVVHSLSTSTTVGGVFAITLSATGC